MNSFYKFQTFTCYSLACLAVVVCMLSFSGSVWGQEVNCTGLVTDGFDYPIGDRGYVNNHHPVPVMEQIGNTSASEKNNLYPNNHVDCPDRGRYPTKPPGWYNVSDIGNYVPALKGIHTGEDWNTAGDEGEVIYAVANGKIIKIAIVYGGDYQSMGYRITIEHELPSGTKFYSVYTHVTALSQTSGSLVANLNDFKFQDNPNTTTVDESLVGLANKCVLRGTPIARIAKGMTFSGISSHLHLEIRDKNPETNGYYPNANTSGYYGAEVIPTPPSTCKLPANKVQTAYQQMQSAGFLDPSDFIDDNRPTSVGVNDNIPIYGGNATSTTGRVARFHFYYNGAVIPANLQAGGQGSRVRVGSLASPSYATVTAVTASPSNPNQKIVTVTMPVGGTLSNESNYDISFQLTLNSKVYTGTNLVYYVDPNQDMQKVGLPPITPQQISAGRIPWMYIYANLAVRFGYMRTAAGGKLKRGEAAALIVRAALETSYENKLNGSNGLAFAVNISIANGHFPDVSPRHSLFPYIQTLLNYDYLSTSGVNFNPDADITLADLAKMICDVFRIPNTFPTATIAGSKVVVSANTNIAKLQKVAVVRTVKGVRYVETPISNLVENNYGIFNATQQLSLANGAFIRRSALAKMLVNVVQSKLNGDAGEKSTSDLTNFTTIGDKFELQDNVAGTAPATVEGETTMFSGQNIIIGSNSTGTLSDGTKLHYYWSVSRGTLVSLHSTHKSVSYTAPIVTVPTVVDMYIYIGAENGQSGEGVIKITVNPLPAGCNPNSITATATSNASANAVCTGATVNLSCTVPSGATVQWTGPNNYASSSQNPTLTNVQTSQDGIYYCNVTVAGCTRTLSVYVNIGTCYTPPVTPTVQASNLNFSEITPTSVKLAYTRGGGQNILIFASPQPITVDPTEGVQYYGSNSDYTQAAIVNGNNQVRAVYYGQASNVTITGLQASNSVPWYFRLYEVNGIATDSKYLKPALQKDVLIALPIPIVDIQYSSTTVIAGQPVTFWNNGSETDLTNILWTIQGGTPATSTAAWGVNGVVFNTAGTYNVTYTATNMWGGTTTQTKPITVLNPNAVQPDIQGNVSVNNPTSVQGQNLIITTNISNMGIQTSGQFHVSYYISTNTTYEVGDYLVGNDLVTTDLVQGASVTLTKTIVTPFALPAGSYYVLAVLDVNNWVIETNETNNTRNTPLDIVTALPDLIITSATATPTTVNAGNIVNISGQMKNIGSGPTTNANAIFVTAYFSSENVLNSNAVHLGDFDAYYNNSVGINQTVNFSGNRATFQLANNGLYYLILKVDDLNNSGFHSESNENNNTFVIPITINNGIQPTIPASNYITSNITATTANVAWNNGNGENRIVVVSEGNPMEYFSSDNSTLTIDAIVYANSNGNFANGAALNNSAIKTRVVYNGNANSINITNLEANKFYYVAAFEYNGTGTSTNYLQNKVESIAFQTNNNPLATGWQKQGEPLGMLGHIVRATPNKNIFIADINAGNILKSSNNGFSWRVSDLTLQDLGATSNSVADMFFVSNDVGYVLFQRGQLFKTINQGVTWTAINNTALSNEMLDAYRSNLYFLDANLGYITVPKASNNIGALYKTTDGGLNWIKVFDAPRRLWDIQFVTPNIGYMSADRSSVFKSTDGGVSWQSIFIQAPEYTTIRYKMQFINQDVGIIGSPSGDVFKTIDGGLNWIKINSQTFGSGYIGGLLFVNDNVAYVSKSSGKLYKTSNGGVNWSEVLGLTPFVSSLGTGFAKIGDNELFCASQHFYRTITGGEAQAIQAPTVSVTSACRGGGFSVSNSVLGTFNAGNVFSVQLSNEAGEFSANPLTIGSVTATSNGTIVCTLPNGIPAGAYKVRIVSSNPVAVGVASTSSITVAPLLDATFAMLSPAYCVGSASVTLSPTTSGGVFSGAGVSGTTFSPTVAGIGTHTLTYTLTQGSCTFSSTQTVAVTSSTVSITASNTTGCKGESVLLQVSSPKPNATYQWQKNGVNITGATAFMYFVTEAGIANYSVLSTEGACAVTSNLLAINIIDVPKPTITSNGIILASSATTGNQWYFNGVAITGATSQFFTMNHTTAGFYTVVVSQSICQNTSDVLAVPAPPNAPQNLVVVSNGSTQASLTWQDASINETGFVIERSTNATTGFINVGTPVADAISFTDFTATALATGGTYYYRVMATGTYLGSGYSNVASVSRAQTITFNALPAKTFGDAPFSLSATASSNLTVSYVSSNANVATISGNTVTIVGAGTTTITASQAGSSNYNPATEVTQNLVVNKANQTIAFNALPTKTFGDASFALSATASSGLAVSYASSNTNVATISGNTVTIVGAGTTTITASQAGSSNYNPVAEVTQNLVVNKANQTITFNALPTKTFGDAPFVLIGSVNSSLAITYSSSNPSVATVSGNTVTIVGVGTTTITASQNGDNNHLPATSVTQNLVVNKATQTINFPAIADKVYGDLPFALNATASSGLAVSYSITTTPATGVATLSGNTITIVGLGSVSVTASQAGNTNYNPATEVVRTFQVVYPTNVLPNVTVAELVVYPNPSQSGIFEVSGLQSVDKQQVSYMVVDPSGKEIQHGIWAGKDRETLDLQKAVSGNYTLVLQGSKAQTSKKIIKQ